MQSKDKNLDTEHHEKNRSLNQVSSCGIFVRISSQSCLRLLLYILGVGLAISQPKADNYSPGKQLSARLALCPPEGIPEQAVSVIIGTNQTEPKHPSVNCSWV